jgi:hypothetical protein
MEIPGASPPGIFVTGRRSSLKTAAHVVGSSPTQGAVTLPLPAVQRPLEPTVALRANSRRYGVAEPGHCGCGKSLFPTLVVGHRPSIVSCLAAPAKWTWLIEMWPPRKRR